MAGRQRMVDAINAVAERLRDLGQPLEERMAMIDEVIQPILPDPILGRGVSFVAFHKLSQADAEAWGTYCRRFVESGALLSAMDPGGALEFGGAIQGILRWHLIHALELSGAEVFALDHALNSLRSGCELERQAGRILSSNSKRAASHYAQIQAAAAKSRQGFQAEMNRILERRAASALPAVEAVVKEVENRPIDAQLPDEAAQPDRI